MQLREEIPGLGNLELRKRLADHFSPWVVTKKCEQIFSDLISTLSHCEIEKERIILFFSGGYEGEEGITPAYFYEPGSGAGVNGLHKKIILGDEDAWGVSLRYPEMGFFPYDDEDEEAIERYTGFCDAGQNWLVYDSMVKNSLGDSRICVWDHGSALEDARPFPDQDEDSYNEGGLLLRILAYQIYAYNNKYISYSYG